MARGPMRATLRRDAFVAFPSSRRSANLVVRERIEICIHVIYIVVDVVMPTGR